jgi:hypothetical protein
MEKPPNPVYFFIKFPADLQEGNIETSFEKDHTFLPVTVCIVHKFKDVPVEF